jgi:outer membrane protein assembly factor BamB
MISTDRFLDLLAEKELLSPRAVASLRAQIAQAAKPTTAESVAKRLVKHGHITAAQAKRLLATDEQAPPSSKPAAVRPQAARSPAKPSRTEDDLGFAPIEGESAEPRAAVKPAAHKAAATQPAARQQAPGPVTKTGSLLHQAIPASPESAGGAAAGRLDLLSAATLTGAADRSVAAPLSARGKGLLRWFARKPKVRRETEEEKWGGPLMLVGGGGLLFLVIALCFLVYANLRGKAEAMLKLADDDYRAGSYSQAINKYETFLQSYPKREGSSLARVRIGLAELRQATQNGGNWPAALQVASDVLKKIAVENDFKEAHAELAAMLPAIADGLAEDARKKIDPALVEQSRQAVAMTEKYVPKAMRPASKLKDIGDSLALTVREIDRGNELDKTIAAMREAAKKSKTEAAYAACSALLHQYPDLADNARLKKTLLAVSQAQQALVKTVSEKRPAAADTGAADPASVTLAQRDTKIAVPDIDGQIALAAVDGAVYGLDAATGKVLWRRLVGFNVNPQAPSFPPTPLSTEPGSDALVVDAARNELLRIEGSTGRIRWRYAVGEPIDAYPTIAGENVLVATRSGKLITIAAASGASPGYVLFPQPLEVAPAIDTRQSLIYQVAAHTNVFILSLDDGACQHVDYLGHEPGSVVTAPLVIDEYLLVAVNDGARDSELQVLAIAPKRSDKPEPWLKPVQQIRLEGHVLTRPLVEGRRVLVTTSSGSVRVFELSATDAKTPLRDIANTDVKSADNLVRFAVMQNGQFWIADNRLTKYDVQAARGRLMAKWIADEDSAYLQPPVALGQAVVSVRRTQGMPGAVVSAVDMQDPEKKYWETRLASPLASPPLVLPDGRIVAVTANGGVFRIDAGRFTPAAIVDEPIAAADAFRLRQPVVAVVGLVGGLLAISSGAGSDQVGVLDPKDASPPIYWLRLPDKLACAPAAFGRGLLAPCKAGPVYLLDPDPQKTGQSLAEPFQPQLEVATELDWMTPVVVGEKEAILVDAKTRKAYRLGVQEQPKPHLAALANGVVTKPVVAPLAVLGETAYLGDTAGGLDALTLPALSRGNEQALGSRCAWRPPRAGDAVLLSTDDNRLLCLDSKGNRRWETPLEHGPLAGAPLSIGEGYVLASRSGILWRIEAATGKTLGKIDLHSPLGTGPAALGQQLIVGGHDGTLYETRQP